MKKFILKLITVLVALPALVGAALYLSDQGGVFEIAKVQVILAQEHENQQLYFAPKLKEIEEKVQSIKGKPLWQVSIRSLKDFFIQPKWVKDFSIQKTWPNELTVQIEPYSVEALLVDSSGGLYPVVDKGKLLVRAKSSVAPDVVLLRGKNFERDEKLRAKALEVLRQIPNEGPLSLSTISELKFDDKEGFWLSLIESGIQVKLGKDGILEKSERVSQVIEALDQRRVRARVIDADFSKKVLVKPRKNP